jgi:hypothetical protein
MASAGSMVTTGGGIPAFADQESAERVLADDAVHVVLFGAPQVGLAVSVHATTVIGASTLESEGAAKLRLVSIVNR